MSWGANTDNESKPKWRFLTAPGRKGGHPKSTDVHATPKGWALRHAWGDEVIVAIGGLSVALGAPTISSLYTSLEPIVNAAAQSVSLLVKFNEAVLVTGTPTILAIGDGGAANVTLSYVSAESDLTIGQMVFANTVNLAAVPVGATLTVNATSTLVGFNAITDAANTSLVVANTIPETATFTVEAA